MLDGAPGPRCPDCRLLAQNPYGSSANSSASTIVNSRFGPMLTNQPSGCNQLDSPRYPLVREKGQTQECSRTQRDSHTKTMCPTAARHAGHRTRQRQPPQHHRLRFPEARKSVACICQVFRSFAGSLCSPIGQAQIGSDSSIGPLGDRSRAFSRSMPQSTANC